MMAESMEKGSMSAYRACGACGACGAQVGSGYEEADARRGARVYLILWGAWEESAAVSETLRLLSPFTVAVRSAETVALSSLARLLAKTPESASCALVLRRSFFSTSLAVCESLLPCDVLGAATRTRAPDGEVRFPWGKRGEGFSGCFVAAAETSRVLGELLLRNPSLLSSDRILEGWMRHACCPRLLVADYDLMRRLPMDGALSVLFCSAPTCPLAWEAFLSRAPALLWSALVVEAPDGDFWSDRLVDPDDDARLSLLRRAVATTPRASHFLLAPPDSAALWGFKTFASSLAWGESYFDDECCCVSRGHALELLERRSRDWYQALRHLRGVRRRTLCARLATAPRFLTAARLAELAASTFLVSGVRGDCPVEESRDAPLDVVLAGRY